MGIRFRKSVKIAPGIRVNFSKSGTSMSLGPRRASVSIGKRGAYLNAGVPGTGLSSRTELTDSQNARQFEREQRRIEREKEKLEELRQRQKALASVVLKLNDKGAIEATNAFGEALSGSDMRLLWEKRSAEIAMWLQEQCDEINGDVELLAEIHLDTPFPNSEPVYVPVRFDIKAPEKPKKLPSISKPEFHELAPLSFWNRLFRSRRLDHKLAMEANRRQYDNELAEWRDNETARARQYKTLITQWESATKAWIQQKAIHEASEKARATAFGDEIRTDIDLMLATLEDVFGGLSWPRETLISYQLESEGREVWLDVDLPEIEDLPKRVATFSANGKKLNMKNKSQKQLRQEYATHVHGIALRLAGNAMAALPRCETIVVSGYSQRLDSTTGLINDEYLYSVKYTREGLAALNYENLEKVDPIEVITRFENRRKMTATGVFKAIEPYSV